MAEKEKSGPDKLSVQLNEAFERLEKQQRENERAEQVAAKTPPPKAAPTRRSAPIASSPTTPSSPLNVAGMLLALIALGIASYAAFTVRTATPTTSNASEAVTGRLGEVEARFRESLTQVDDLRTRLDQVTADLAAMSPPNDEELAAFRAQIQETLKGMQDRIGTSSQDWLLAEVEYLLRVGAQRVEMEQDAKGALVLYRSADRILHDAEGITAFDLRKAIATDIVRLEAVADVDVDGIFVRLAALASQVDVLHQTQRKFEAKPIDPEAHLPTADPTLSERTFAFLARVGERLASLVDYRGDGQRIAPILPPKEEYYLRQNLVLKIQMAQLGLLRGDQDVYVGSLNEAQSWVVEHFDANDPATTAMLTSLNELAQVNVESELPDVTGSLAEVRKLLAKFHQAPAREQVAQ